MDRMDKDYFMGLIAKKLSGSLNTTEAREIQRWLQGSSENQMLYQKYEKLWFDGKKEITCEVADEIFGRVQTKMDVHGLDEMPKVALRPARRLWPRYLKVAASILILLSAGFGLFRITQKANINADSPSVSGYISKSNPSGQKSLIILPDGSKVKLNSESYLEYPTQFEGTEREVKLVGEAFFEVQKDPLKPFIVKSGSIDVKVLGTSFNIKAHPYEKNYSVAVATGKVAVSKGIESGSDTLIAMLSPDEMVQIDHDNETYKIKKFDTDKVMGWKDGILVFDNDNSKTIIKTLEQWYGVRFVLSNNDMPTAGYTGRYQNATLKMVMDGWSYTSNFQYRIEGKNVYIE